MEKKRGHLITAVDPGSIAEELELEPGDRLLTIDGEEVEDIFDYEYKIGSESVTVVVEKRDGEEWELEIENDYEDLGLTFENGLMSEYRSCRNKCIFCFIDQMPPGMRETLYFKDDDSRLSFLQGNYITLTNMSDRDIERIIQFKLAPINISVHTTNPELRCRMLNNRFAGRALREIGRLFEAGIPMNGQIVLCKGVNDGEELDRTIRDLAKYLPCMESVSVVPVGLSRFREGLYPLEPFGREDAVRTLQIVERWQEQLFREHGNHFIHASDEFYLLAERELPEAERYDGYPQLENGVGMLRLLREEVEEALAVIGGAEAIEENAAGGKGEAIEKDTAPGEVSIATGYLAYPHIRELAGKVEARFPGLKVRVYPIRNDFFGDRITVSGLITGQDLLSQLRGKELGKRLLLTCAMFRSGEEIFLDDLTKKDVETALQLPISIVKSSGHDFVRALLEPAAGGEAGADYGAYELPD